MQDEELGGFYVPFSRSFYYLSEEEMHLRMILARMCRSRADSWNQGVPLHLLDSCQEWWVQGNTSVLSHVLK